MDMRPVCLLFFIALNWSAHGHEPTESLTSIFPYSMLDRQYDSPWSQFLEFYSYEYHNIKIYSHVY